MKDGRQPTVDSRQLETKTQPIQTSPINARTAGCFLFLITAILFWDFLTPGTSLVLSKLSEDMTQDFIGWRQFAFDQLRQGNLALWNPQMLCGAPFFGDFQSAILYPPNWLFLFLSMPLAVNTGIALHVFLMGWFTYLWIVQRGSRPESALVSAFMVMFGGAYFLHLVPGHLPNLCSMVWVPLIFMAVDGYREKREKRWIFLGIFALALQILSGHVQYVYYTAIVGGFYLALLFGKIERKGSFFLGILAMGLGAALLTAVQLGAGWDAARDSLRGQKLPIDIVDIADMTPERLWCLLAPDFFGSWNNYWGGGFYWEGATFVSLTAFVLALFAFKVSDHPQTKKLGWLTLFLVVLSVGKRTPLFVLFYHYCPLFGNFRGVSKLNIFITLFLAVLTALALDEILKDSKRLRMLAKPLGWGALAVFLLVLAFWLAPHLGAEKFYEKFSSHAASMEESLLICGFILGVLSALSFFVQKYPSLRYGFILLSCLELFWFAKSNLPFFEYKDYVQKISQIERVCREDPGDYRVLVGNSYALSTSGSDIWGEDPVIPARYASFVALTQDCDANNAFLQRFTFTRFPPSLGLLRLRYKFDEEGDLLKVEKFLFRETPRAFITDRWEILNQKEALRKAAGQGVAADPSVLLESDPGLKSESGKFKSRLKMTDLSTDQIEVEAELSKPGILVVTDNYSAGWRARSLSPATKEDYKVVPANGFQRALPLPAGSHHLLLEYRPAAYVIGKWISITAWVIFLLLILREYLPFRSARSTLY